PNGLLRHTLDTHTGSIAAALAGGGDPYADRSATVTVNVTFYSLLDLAAHNLTDALSGAEVRERLAELDGRLDEGARAAILAALPSGNPPRGWHFIPEATVEVGPSGYEVSCRAPSMAPLRQPLHAAAAYLAAVGATSAHATLQASLRGIEATGWQDCPMALSSIHAHVAAAVAALDARIAASGDSYLAEARAALLAGQRGMDGAAAKSVGRAAPQSATWVPLATDPNLTSQAPPGPYVGIVRITTQDQCIRLLDGSQGACRDVTEHSMATLTLVDHSSFVLRDRAGRPMPGRPVTLERLAAAVNCAGPTDAPDMGASTTALGRLFHGATSFATTTDAQGIARFPWVPPGIYDLKDGSVGFPIHGAWEPAGPETGESEGFGEVDCHKPVPIHAGLDGAARSLLSATGRMPCAKTAARGLPVLSPLWALDAHAGSRLPGPCGSGMGRTEAGAVAAGLRAALNATFGPEAWQIVFPQVQQTRLADDVQADHVDAFALFPSLVPAAHPWVFTRDGLRMAAEGTMVASDGSPLLAAPAAFRYSYPLPPNEELAMKWKFTAQMTNAAGVAIFTIRDDLDAVLGALANRNPASAAEAAGHLSDLLGDSAEDPVTSCAPAAHYRIVPLSPMEAEAHVHGLSGPAGKAGVEASLMGTEERVSRLFRFHTRECQRDTAHAAFLFFPLPVTASHEAPPRVEFAVQDQGIWTWGGVGSPARGCPGEWCLLKLPGEAAMAAPVAMDTMDESALWIGNPFDPRIEGRDVFVDLMDHTRVLVGPPGAPGPQSFLLHPNHEDAPPMGIAPGVPATVAEWLAEARRSARLDAAGARLDPEGERRLRHDPWTMPDRNPGPTGDHSTLDWQPERRQTTFGPPTDMRDSSPNRAHASNQGAIPVASGRFAGGYLLGAEGSHARVPLAGTPMESGTIMMWVRPDQDRLWDELFFHGTPGGPLQLMLRLDPTGRVVFQTGTSTQMSVSGGSVPSGQWTHVAATWEPGATRIFVNGNEVASIPRSAGVPGGYTHTLIGNLPGTYPGYVGTHGILDEVREHSVALDAATIRSLMEVPYAAADGSPSPHPTGAPRLVGNEVFAYAFDGPAHASGGHMARRAVLGIGTE
ncbi:MAG TPA: LamG domain-containing protein, partial [Candidatus Thermoplasmatota archaeon]|nr:LamG domain-containing protein [Candidatus Thermoplasmatota archaeon]